DLGEREAHVDEHPVAGLDPDAILVEQPDVDVAVHSSDIDLRETIGLVDDLDHLPGDREAHTVGHRKRARVPREAGVLDFNVGFQPATCAGRLVRVLRRGTPDRGLADADRVRVLEQDPELGLRIPADSITRARKELCTRLQAFECGIWEVPDDDGEPARLGYLVLEGLLGRDVILAGKTCTELLGESDVLLPPSAYVREEKLVRYHVQWHVIEPVRLAVLDDAFARRLTEWPQVTSALFERGMRRALRM